MKVGVAAVGTGLRHSVGIAAIVAAELAGRLVIGQRHIAMFAMRHPPTHLTLHHRSETAAVLEQYHLLALLERLSDGRQ